jgi:aryl-alcohol dehydrogenase-like predicted oxidoreductase
MTFGGKGFWEVIGQSGQDVANDIVARSLDAGINFIDTANVYSFGESETILGKALAGRPRDQVVIATKVRGRMNEDVNGVGLSRFHIMNSVEASLKRLNTDHIDLYQIHGFDAVTPLDETLRALDDIVRQGKVRYIGASNLAAWQLMKALGLSDKLGLTRFESLQAYYTIAGRDLEREVIPLVQDQQVGVMVWSPLAGGAAHRQVPAGWLRPGGQPPRQLRLPLRGQGARLRLRGRDAQGRRGVGRQRGADRPGVAAAPARRDDGDHRSQEHGPA